MRKKVLNIILSHKEYWTVLILFIAIVGLTGNIKPANKRYNFQEQDTTDWPATFKFGRPASQQEIAKLDIDVRPDGTGLPEGTGNSKAGKNIYVAKCAACHGNGTEPLSVKLPAVPLVNIESIGQPFYKVRTIANYWPYATTLFDYIRRAMPLNAPGSLTNKEVYSLSAYILSANQLIDSTLVLNNMSLPRVVMPAQKAFIADDRKGGPEVK